MMEIATNNFNPVLANLLIEKSLKILPELTIFKKSLISGICYLIPLGVLEFQPSNDRRIKGKIQLITFLKLILILNLLKLLILKFPTCSQARCTRKA